MVGKRELSSSYWIISDCLRLKGRLLHCTAEIPPNLLSVWGSQSVITLPISPVSFSRPNTFICVQSSRLNLCLNALSNSVGYGGLCSLHCSCYFSNYIDIKLFFPCALGWCKNLLLALLAGHASTVQFPRLRRPSSILTSSALPYFITLNWQHIYRKKKGVEPAIRL